MKYVHIQPSDRNISWKCRCMKIRKLNPKWFYSILLSNLLAELFWKVSQFFIFYLGCILSAKRSSNKTQSIQQMASAKMTVKSMISKVKVCTNLESFYDKNVFKCNLFNFLAKSRRRKYENRSQRSIWWNKSSPGNAHQWNRPT